MIKASFIRDERGRIRQFQIRGHAAYAEEGQDIVCSAVSALAVNAVNSIEALTEARLRYTEADGLVTCTVEDADNEKAQLLLQSLALGLIAIRDRYGEKYITIRGLDVPAVK